MPALLWRHSAPLLPGARLPAVDELKGVALLLVLVYHASSILGWPNTLQGQVGVDLFLLLSGFTLSLGAAATEPARAFFRRRFFRIFPAYWAALILFLALDYFLRGLVHPAPRIWLHAVGLHAFASEGALWGINDSLWFIALIVPLYAAFALLRRWLDRPADLLGAGCLLTVAACLACFWSGNAGTLSHLAVRIPSFFVGLMVGRAASAPEFAFRPTPLLGAGALALAWLTLDKNLPILGVFAAPAVGTAWLALREFLPSAALRPFAWLGIYSYEIYLLHQPLIREYNTYAWQHLRGVASPSGNQLALGVALGLVVTVILAIALHHAAALLFPRRARPTSP